MKPSPADPSTLLDPYCRLLLADRLKRAGLDPDGPLSAEALAAGLGALPKYRPLLAAYAGILRRGPALGEAEALAPDWRAARAEVLAREPALSPHLALAEACAESLPAVLAGEIPATDLLFPGGGMQRVEPIYRDNPWSDHFNALAAAACGQALETWSGSLGGGAPARVLEIGAGTGGTSASLLPALAARRLPFEYLYTDISAGFVAHGQRRFGGEGYPIRFRCLDIERDPGAQGIPLQAAHVVVATNVLHATRNIRNTLGRVRSLLVEGGILLLNELTRADAFAALTFGLLDGWWLFEDAPARLPGAPILSADGWRRALADSGFADPAVYGWDGREDGFQCLFVSESRAAAASPSLAAPVRDPEQDQPVQAETPLAPAADAPAVRRRLRALLATRLGFDGEEIDPDRPFAELGVDSIVAPQFAADLSAALGVAVDALDVFNHATLNGLAAALAPRLPGPAGAAAQPLPGADSPAGDAVAIIGLACRFPGAPNADAFWDLLREGRDATGPVPAERWGGLTGTAPATAAGLLPDADRFDPDFFHLSHAEAEVMDPQQRVFLQACWHALEDAGLAPDRLGGETCGVYVGVAAQNHPANTGEARAALGNSNAILAARIAYHLDFKGPAIPVDTACSSSLVAIHLAAQAIRDGECDLALAGGVSVLLCTPALPRFLVEAGMVSPSGRCQAFDRDADGFVPAEGVGVVALRRLGRAQAAGDRILGVIRGSGVNQDGRSSGITAPSGPAQTALLQRVWARAGIDPASLSLIEAHGTGTPLGDPIEVQSLAAAFGTGASGAARCALGSVKTNIGHALTAAGVAGVIKVLLALRHRTIPASLHFRVPNPRLDLDRSPFYVPTDAGPWVTPPHQPRRAAVSSFGFSGTNAHLVIEEAPATAVATRLNLPRLVLVSARDEAALGRTAGALARWLEQRPDTALEDICRTLNRGRAVQPARAALLAEGTAELIGALGDLARGAARPGLWVGHHRDCAPALDAEAVERLGPGGPTDPGSLPRLAELFSAGAAADWDLLGGTGQVLSLPGYPFARDRFPLPREPASPEESPGGTPLLAMVPAGDPAFAGHRWDGLPLFPASALLLLAARSLGDAAAGTPVSLEDVRWHLPVESRDTSVVLRAAGAADGRSRIVLEGERGLHAEALVRAARPEEAPTDPAPQDSGLVPVLGHEAVYRRFADLGFDYGPAFRVVQSIASGPDQAVARLEWQAGVDRGGIPQIALLDGTIQSALGLAAAAPDAAPLTVIPFALERAWLDPATLAAPLRVRVQEDRAAARPGERRLTILAWNEAGRPAAHLAGLRVRVTEARRSVPPGTGASPPSLPLLYRPVWREAPPLAPVDPGRDPVVLLFDRGEARARLLGPRTLLVERGKGFRRTGPGRFELPPGDPQALDALAGALAEQGHAPGLWLNLWPLNAAADAEAGFAQGPGTLLHGLRAWLPRRPKGRPLGVVQACRATDPAAAGQDPAFAGAAGLLLSLGEEEPRFNGKTVAVVGAVDDESLIRRLLAEAGDDTGVEVVLSAAGQRFLRGHERVPAQSGGPETPLPRGAVCLISGGLGGLGLTLAGHLWGSRRARLALLGRRAPRPEAERELGRLRNDGAQILVLNTDVTEPQAMAAACATVADRLGPVQAVFHLAGTQHDGFLGGLPEAAAEAVIAPKLVGTRNLLQACADQPTRLFVAYGSVAGALGSPGQAPYAAANRAMTALLDQAARARPDLVVRTLDWGYWDPRTLPGGMQARDREDGAVAAVTGLVPLSAEQGLALLERVLDLSPAANPGTRLLALQGDSTAFERFLSAAGTRVPAVAADSALPADAEHAALAYVAARISEITRTPPERLGPDRPIEEFGIDSIMITRVNTRLEQDLGRVSKTLLFEHTTLRSLADSLARTHGSAILAQARAIPVPPAGNTAVTAAAAPLAPGAEDRPPGDEPIAVIGMAGRFPQAPDLDAYWRNLIQGRVCISEIPEDRWPLAGFYDPEPGRPGLSYSKWGGFLDGVDRFDPLFFSISPEEASRMDPQERLFLETAWQCLEDAGLTLQALGTPGNRDVGVFVGVMYGDYQLLAQEGAGPGRPIGGAAPYWTIANRVSYGLGLEGPSVALDSACSSSLTAVHLACQALRTGDCRAAFAGGVNLSLHPAKYVGLSQGRFASTDGRCRSFGAGGDGYVPGEGVAAVLLKPLSAALRDGDYIHGLIRSSAINHGGRTNGYTVPSPGSQAAVIRKALDRAGSPAPLEYIEAHGTGTRLGDPIEIQGIAQALGDRDPARPVAIGSAKASIGHLEAAAGIAGLIKVLLQMRHGRFAPLPLEGPINPDIDLATAPLRLLTEAEDWPEGAGGRRTAGISSFGAGGANAHVILEGPPAEAAAADAPGPRVIPLSARTEAQVRALAGRLAEHLADPGQRPGVRLDELCHTLSLGREHLRSRCAFLAADLAGARHTLAAIGAGNEGPEVTWGEAPADSEGPPAPPSGADLDGLARHWARGGDPLWPCQGRRRPLVARPFLGTRHWLRTLAASAPAAPGPIPDWEVETAPPEPGELGRWRFRVPPGASLLADHRVGGEPLLPGAAVAAMALEGARLAGLEHRGLRNLVWASPVSAETARLGLTLSLRPADSGVSFALLPDDGPGAVPCATGLLGPAAVPPPPTGPMGEPTLDAEAFYSALERMGITYGPRYRRVAGLRPDPQLAWAELLPPPQAPGPGDPVLDPVLLDTVFQALGGLIPELGQTPGDGAVPVPHTLESLALQGDPRQARGVWSRRVSSPDGPVQRFDLHLVDGDGRPLLHLGGLSARPRRLETIAPAAEDAPPVTLMRPVWLHRPPPGDTPAPPPAAALVLTAPGAEELAGQLAARLPGALVFAAEAMEAIDSALQRSAASLFYLDTCTGEPPPPGGDPGAWSRSAERRARGLLGLLGRLSQEPLRSRIQRLVVATRGLYAVHDLRSGDDWLAGAADAAGLHGLAKVAARELQPIPVIAVDLPVETDPGALDLLARESGDVAGAEIAYRRGRRLARRLRPVGTEDAGPPPLPTGGHCLMVGGAGGIGRSLAAHWARVRGARVTLVGRRPPDPDLQAFLARLRSLGGDGLYLQADATDAGALRRAVDGAIDAFGPVDLALHAALVLADRSLAATDPESFRAAFAPRAAAGANLIAALAGRPPAGLVLFSSANLFLGQPGQANYVAGNAALAALGQAARAAGMPVRLLHWGLWGEVGAVADAATQGRFRAEGVLPITPALGAQALAAALAGDTPETAAVRLTRGRLEALELVESEFHRPPRGLDPVPATSPAVAAALALVPADPTVARARDAFSELERLGRLAAARTLRAMAGKAAGRRMTFAGLCAGLRVTPPHQALLKALLARLADDALVEVRDGLWRLAPLGLPETDGALDAQRSLVQRIEIDLPWLAPNRTLLEACIDAYGPILHGEQAAVAVLLPEGSGDRVAAAYTGNPISDRANALVAAAVASDVRARLAAGHPGPVRIIEVGTGTGGTTATVLAALEPLREQVRYRLSDLSPHLARSTAARFGEAGWSLEATALDAGRDPLAQGETPASYDLVLAANVVHATADLGRTLGHLKTLLRTGGRIVLNELTGTRDLGTLVFGLTPEWWGASDRDTRLPGGPGAAPEVWRDLLAEAGYVDPILVAVEDGPDPSSQGLITAVSDGWVAVPGDRPVAGAQSQGAAETQDPGRPTPAGGDRERVLTLIRGVFSDVLGVAPGDLRGGDTFERYGMESLSAMEVRNRIAQTYPSVSSTLLFEHDTVDRLADHLLGLPQPADIVSGPPGDDPDDPPESAPSTAPAGHPAPGIGGDGPIAVVGFAGRFPGGSRPEDFWALLREGRSAIGPVPPERWDHDRFFDGSAAGAPAPGHSRTRWGGFIEGIDRFDPLFFGISPVEADSMDPQERLFIEACWNAMEDAGTTPARLATDARRSDAAGSVGVFCGVMNTAYQWLAAEAWRAGDDSAASSHFWSIPNRVSYLFDFDGPSIALDTACSSSLTAVHLACDALRRGDCGAALAGGVNLIAHPRQLVNLSQAGMVSGEAECRAFGAEADGFVDGEGVGVVLLKPLSRALEDGDRIDGLILASAVNAGGKTGGFTVPSPRAQGDLIATALDRAGLGPDDLCLIETHGTGTSLGDPIEVTGLTRGLKGIDPGRRLPLGTLKANIGHLESAAGAASLIKVLLQLRHRTIAPARQATNPNPLIAWGEVPFRLPAEAEPWPRPPKGRRRAAISGFGAGGANAHLILEEPPETAEARVAQPLDPEILPLSACTEAQLRQLAGALASALGAGLDGVATPDPGTLLADLGRSLRQGRVDQACRAVVLAGSATKARDGLAALAEGASLPGLWRQQTPPADAGPDTDLVRRWLAGEAISWEPLATDPRARPLPLPTYPFAGTRHWIAVDPAPPQGAGIPARRASVTPLRPALQVYQRGWDTAPRPPSGHSLERQQILLLGGSAGLAAGLQALGHGVTRLKGGTANPWDQALAQAPAGPLSLIAVQDRSGEPEAAWIVAGALDLARAAARSGRPLRVLHLTPPGADGRPQPCALAADTLFRSLAGEAPGVLAGSLTLPRPGDAGAADTLVGELEALGDGGVRHLWYRDGRRLQADIQDAPVPEGPAATFRRGGHYLIVGGLGEVGRRLGAALIERFDARITILGRSPLDAQGRERIQALGPAGRVSYHRCDIADRAALDRVLADIAKDTGPIHGALHLGRAVSPSTLAAMTAEGAAATLAPKVQGSLGLVRALGSQGPDWILLFSSLAGWAGQAGGADYAAACAFQDGLAMAAPGNEPPLLSVAWPQWEHDRYLSDAKRELWSTLGLQTIDAQIGLDALEQVLAMGSGAYGVLRGSEEAVEPVARELARFRPAGTGSGEALRTVHPWAAQLGSLDLGALSAYRDYLRAELGKARVPAVEPAPAVQPSTPSAAEGTTPAAPPDLPRARIGEIVLETCADYLKTDPKVLAGARLPDLGLDSIRALHLADRLQRRLGRPVEPVMLFENPTIEGLAEALAAPEDARESRASRKGAEP